MGWTSTELSPLSRLFVEFCRENAGAKVLDIGAAYGIASMAALEAGAHVVANDLDKEHLEEIRRRAGDHPRLELKPGKFPRYLHFEDSTLDAVHASNVFHFLTGNQLVAGFRAIARWLRPGGKLFVQAATPWQSPFAGFLPEYERRVEAGVKWPGYVARLGEFVTHRQFGQMPREIHLLDGRILARLAEDAGLRVERVWLYRRPDLPQSIQLDGRESVALVACSIPDRPL